MLRVGTMDQEESDALWDFLDSDETAQINTQLSFKIQGPNGAAEIPAWVDSVFDCSQDCFETRSQRLVQDFSYLTYLRLSVVQATDVPGDI